MLMRERIHDSQPRRSSPSPTSDPDRNESSVIKPGVVSSRSDQIGVVSHDVQGREQDIDEIRRDSDLYDVQMQRRIGFSNKDRREEEERDDEHYMKHFHLQEDSNKQYANASGLNEESKPSRFITSHDYENSPSHGRNVLLKNDKTNRLESISRDYSDSSRHSEDGRDRNTYRYESSPLSQVGSSVVDFQDESSRLVSSDSKCCIRVNDSDRVDERRREDYNGDLCASQGPHTMRVDDYVGRISPRDQQGEYFRGLNCGDHDSPTVSKYGKEIVDESRNNYLIGSDIAVKEFPSVRHDTKNMARESNLLMQTRGSLSKSHVRGSNIADVDAADTHLEFSTKERMADQYESVKEHYPFVELGSRVVNEGDDKDYHYMNFRNKERKVVDLDNKCQLLRKDYQYDGVDRRKNLDFSEPYAVVYRDDKASQSMTRCLNKEREAYLDDERNAVYSDEKRRELRNDYHVGNDGRMHSDVDKADIVVDQDGRVMQLQRVCLNKGKTEYLDNERKDVLLNDKTQQLEKEYDSRSDARIYPDVNRLDILVDREREVARGLRYRGVSSNDRREAYLQCESQQLLNDHETNSYGMMHPDVNKSDILVDHEDARGLRYRGVFLNDKKEAYLRCESQRLLNDHETDSYVVMYPDVNNSDNLVDHEDARGLRYRGVPLNDRKESYFQCETQKLLKHHETNSYGMMHPNLDKSDIFVDQEDARALELIRNSYDDGKESYMDYRRGDAYLRYESQQLKKDYDYGIDVNCSDIIVDHRDARRVTSSDRNEVYLDNESKDVYQYYKKQKLKDYDSGINEMYPDVTKSEIVVDRGCARALERRGVSLNEGREAYLHYESQKLPRDHEIDSYGMMHPDVSRSSAGKQGEEALQCKRYLFDDRNQVYLDDERLQLRNCGHVKGHTNMRYPDGRQESYHSNDKTSRTRDDYGLRDDASEVVYENMAYDYNYRDVKQLEMSYEKPYSGRLRDHGVAYDYIDKLGNFAVEGGASTENFRYLVDERNYGYVDHTSTPRPRVSAKERLGGRVDEDSRVHVKHRLHQVRNPKLKGKSHKRS